MDIMKFVWLCGYFLSFFIGLLLLCVFWKDKISRLAGLYTVIPGISMIIINGLPYWVGFNSMMIISAVIELVLIILIVIFFRHLYRMRFVVPWILLILEIIRWAWLVVSIVIYPNSALGFFEAYLFYFYFIIPFAFLLFSVFNSKSNILKQVNN